MHWRRKWQSTPVFLPGKFYGQSSLLGYSPRGCNDLSCTRYTFFQMYYDLLIPINNISVKQRASTQLLISFPIMNEIILILFSLIDSVQFTQLCPTLCDPVHRSTPGLPVHHQLPELTQTHVHRVGDAIQPSHPLSSLSPPAFNLSQHQGLFK